MEQLSPYDFSYQKYLKICRENGYLIFFQNEDDFEKVNLFLKREYDCELKLKKEKSCSVYDLSVEEFKEYFKEILDENEKLNVKYELFHIEAVFYKTSLEQRISRLQEKSIEANSQVSSDIVDKIYKKEISEFYNECLKLDINHMHAIIEIDTDYDASIKLNDRNMSEVKIIITGNTYLEVKNKSIERLNFLKNCVVGGKESVNSELRRYMDETIDSIIEGLDSYSMGGNRTLSYYISDGKYFSNEIIF